MVTGIILAGGKSKRFGRNKLILEVDGIKVLDRVFNAVSKSSDVVYISVRNKRQVATLSESCEYINNVRFAGYIYDINMVSGPLSGILSSLRFIDDEAIFVAGDLPWITDEVIKGLIHLSKSCEAVVSSPIWGNGFIESLVTYVNSSIRGVLNQLPWRIRGKARPTDLHRVSIKTCLIPVNILTNDPKVFAHVNFEENLYRPSPRNPVKGFYSDVVKLYRSDYVDTPFLKTWRSVKVEDYQAALSTLYSEMEEYMKYKIMQLIDHVAADIRYVLSLYCGRAVAKSSNHYIGT